MGVHTACCRLKHSKLWAKLHSVDADTGQAPHMCPGAQSSSSWPSVRGVQWGQAARCLLHVGGTAYLSPPSEDAGVPVW